MMLGFRSEVEPRTNYHMAAEALPTARTDSAAGESHSLALKKSNTLSYHNIQDGLPPAGHNTIAQSVTTYGSFAPKRPGLTVPVGGGHESDLNSRYFKHSNDVDPTTELASPMQTLSVSRRGSDPAEIPVAQFGETGPRSQHAIHRSRRNNVNARRGSQSIPSSPRAVVASQRTSVVMKSQPDGPDNTLVVNIDGRTNNYTGRRRRGSRPLSFLGLEDSQECLREKLAVVREKSIFNRDRKFIPERQLFKLVTRTTVELELPRCEHSLRRRLQEKLSTAQREDGRSPQDIQEFARTICGDVERSRSVRNLKCTDSIHTQNDQLFSLREYRKIFAVLLLIRKSHRIRSFVNAGVCDHDLPFVKCLQDSKKLAPMSSPKVSLLCFEGWSDSTIARFEERQWAVLAPVFKRSEEHRAIHSKLGRRAILPFMSWEPVERRGGFGQVYKTEIHPDHHSFNDCKGSKHIFAVKELFPDPNVDPKREITVLRSLSCERHSHPHLITLLATFELEETNTLYLIFPWAERDLLAYWERAEPLPRKDKSTAKWLAQQCQGLAEGLNKIHHWETFSASGLIHPDSIPTANTNGVRESLQLNHLSSSDPIQKLFGRHGDIKPSNILWFPDGGEKGILKITDFGITHFSTREEVPAKSRGLVANSHTYRAPECDFPDWMLSPSADLWALGCVYLEFITWFFGGWKAVQDFTRDRLAPDRELPACFQSDIFFTIEKDKSSRVDKAKVKSAVTKKINDLRSEHTCAEFFHKFLGMIERDMLIVEENELGDKKIGRRCSRRIALDLDSMLEDAFEAQ